MRNSLIQRNKSETGVRQFAEQILAAGVVRGYIVTAPDLSIRVSDPILEDLAELMTESPGFAGHEGVFFQIDTPSNSVFFIFIHKSTRGAAQGGTRLLSYGTMEALLFDGLRLSKAMTDKNAVAGIWWGGGKAIICPLDGIVHVAQTRRKAIFENYGQFVASLNGLYIAAEDMNTTPSDMLTILSVNRFVTCLPEAVGGSANPSPWTALGVFKAMQATLRYYERSTSLKGKRVVVQGAGNVGLSLIRILLENDAHVMVFDPNPRAIQSAQNESSKIEVIESEEALYKTSCDIFAPCARGGVLNSNTIPQLKCRYVIGAANNQLEDADQDAQLLHAQGIVYLPDFFINRMGIVNCANEQYGWLDTDLKTAAEKVYVDTLALLGDAERTGSTPESIAQEIGCLQSDMPHPIWGHRGLAILERIIRVWP